MSVPAAVVSGSMRDSGHRPEEEEPEQGEDQHASCYPHRGPSSLVVRCRTLAEDHRRRWESPSQDLSIPAGADASVGMGFPPDPSRVGGGA
jgi:hypothetical protein